MSDIITQLTGWQTDLTAAGLRVTLDPRNVNPPCVLLVPPRVEMDLNCGGTAEFKAFILVPPPANLDAWRLADDMAVKVGGVVDVRTLEPSSYGVDDSGLLPALEATWEGAVTWP